jgi:chorismate synthase
MSRIRLTTAGESHGPGLTALLTGLPAGLAVDFDFVAMEMKRRMHGYGRGARMRIETDAVEFRGGLRGAETLGTPISLWIANRDFENWRAVMDPVEIDPARAEKRRVHAPRPGHADLAGGIKYLRDDLRDVLERASARESAARVACGALLKLFLRELGIEIRSGVRSLGPIGLERPVPTWEELLAVDDSSPLRAVHRDLEDEMVTLVDRTKRDGDTLGGAVTVIAHGVPAGLGSHVQWNEKLDGRLARALMSVPAVKGVEIGAALTASAGLGSAAHDPIERSEGGEWQRPGNRAGGLEGGVTNGADVVLTAYKKPISTLRQGMPSVDLDTLEPHRSQYERSDVTALPAAGVIAESMVALVLADALLDKLGGDSMAEVEAHLERTLALQRQWKSEPRTPPAG